MYHKPQLSNPRDCESTKGDEVPAGHPSLFADIDECTIPKDNNCPKKALCFNTPGSYLCTCSPGYESDTKQIGELVCIPE